jgi:hypothetical protein
MSNEFMDATWRQAMSSYEIELADAERDFRAAAASGDAYSAADASRRMADTRVRAAEFQRMSHEAAANLRGPVYRQPTKEEIHAMPPEALTPELLAAGGTFNSKYGDVTPDDPYFQYGKTVAAWQRGQGR